MKGLITMEDFSDKRVIAFFATMPEWYRRVACSVLESMSEKDAGVFAKALILTLTGRGNQVNMDAIPEKAKQLFVVSFSWLDDVLECAELCRGEE